MAHESEYHGAQRSCTNSICGIVVVKHLGIGAKINLHRIKISRLLSGDAADRAQCHTDTVKGISLGIKQLVIMHFGSRLNGGSPKALVDGADGPLDFANKNFHVKWANVLVNTLKFIVGIIICSRSVVTLLYLRIKNMKF